MTWKPTTGMLKAESVVQTMLTDAATRHVFITDPTLRHRWVQTIADALDGFRSGVEAEPEFPLEERAPLPIMPLPYRENGAGPGPMPHFDNPIDAQIAAAFPGALTKKVAEPKRRRGRPKGAKAKKAKAAPKADAVEAVT